MILDQGPRVAYNFQGDTRSSQVRQRGIDDTQAVAFNYAHTVGTPVVGCVFIW
jgi:hypothetical protein